MRNVARATFSRIDLKDDFQNRLAGTAIAIFALIALVAIAGLINEACKAADSGPMHSPSEWRR